MATPWNEWAAGVLSQIGAPFDTATQDALWGWSNAESGADVMRWNNPLNTTLDCCGGVPMNSAGVRAYPTVPDGVMATASTLLNGRYPIIVAHLQDSVPRQQWDDACGELGTWGTGCAWLDTDYGDPPERIIPVPQTRRTTVIVAGSGTLHQFGRGTDNALYHRKTANGAWSAWAKLGGTLTSDVISGGVDAAGVLRVSVVGQPIQAGNPGAVYDISSSDEGATWSPFSGPNGTVTGLLTIQGPGAPSAPAVSYTVSGTFTGDVKP